ncbi:MAG: DUF4240 domain-containing protein, partial [Caulobacteraceae bacterium]
MRRTRALILLILAFVAAIVTTTAQATPKAEASDNAPVTMSDALFWTIIDGTTADEAEPEAQLGALREILTGLSMEEVVAFHDAFERQMQRAYTWDLWAVAYIAHGGASDDGFDYFRRWLISKGRAVFEQVVAQPDSLAEVLAADSEGVLEFEEISAVATEVWARKSGRTQDEMPMTPALRR